MTSTVVPASPHPLVLSTAKAHVCFVLLATLYLLRHAALIADENLYLYHDNLGYHFPNFVYLVNSLQHGFGFPRLLLDWGGSEIAISSVSMGYFSPHRLFAYLLYLSTDLTPLSVYKISILLGFTVNAYGWFCLWRRTLPDEVAALGATFFIFLSGIGLTILHQEQLLMTVSWMPWLLLFAVIAHQSGKGLPLAAACAGSALTLHYPQIHVLALSMLLLLLVLFGHPVLRWIKAFGLRVWLAAIACFLAASAPILYVISKKNAYGSPVRETDSFGVATLAEYIKLNEQQISSAPLAFFTQLIFPQENVSDDRMAFYITSIGFALALIGIAAVLVHFKRWRFLPVFVLFAAWCTLGINAYLPQILFIVGVPTVAEFRQWYHFLPYMIAGLAALAGLGASFSLAQFSERGPRAVVFAMLVMAAMTAFVEARQQYRRYVPNYHLKHQHIIPRFSEREFVARLNSDWLKRELPIPYYVALVARKESLKFFKHCPSALNNRVWSAPQAAADEAADSLCKQLTASPPLEQPAVTFTPSYVAVGQGSSSGIVLAINPTLLADPTLVTPVADGALSSVTDTTLPVRLGYAGSGFFAALLLQLLALLAAGGEFLGKKVRTHLTTKRPLD